MKPRTKISLEASIGVTPLHTHHWQSAVGYSNLSQYFFEMGLKHLNTEQVAKYKELVKSLVMVRKDLQEVYHQQEAISQLEYRIAVLLKENINLRAENEKFTRLINEEL